MQSGKVERKVVEKVMAEFVEEVRAELSDLRERVTPYLPEEAMAILDEEINKSLSLDDELLRVEE